MLWSKPGIVVLAGMLLSLGALSCSHTPAGQPATVREPAPSPDATPAAMEECRKRCEEFRMIADCADEQGHMVQCPCHCPSVELRARE
jgi:hypothetical protein